MPTFLYFFWTGFGGASESASVLPDEVATLKSRGGDVATLKARGDVFTLKQRSAVFTLKEGR